MNARPRPLLSRVADAVYWMGRYIERAENGARFLDVNHNLMLDLPRGYGDQWQPIVDTTGDHDAVDLERREPGVDGGRDPAVNLLQRVASGHLLEPVPQQRVARHADSVQPGVGQGLRLPVEQDAVRGHGQVGVGGDLAEHRDELREVGPDRGLPAGELERPHAEAAEDPGQPDDLLEPQDLGLGQPLQALGGHAVRAPEVAAVRDGDPKVVGDPSERVQQRFHGPKPTAGRE